VCVRVLVYEVCSILMRQWMAAHDVKNSEGTEPIRECMLFSKLLAKRDQPPCKALWYAGGATDLSLCYRATAFATPETYKQFWQLGLITLLGCSTHNPFRVTKSSRYK